MEEEEVGESGARLGLSAGGDGSGKEIELPELQEDGSVSQDPVERREGDDGNGTPLLTPEKLNPEFMNSHDLNNEEEKGLCPDHQESSGSATVNTQESIECRSFMEGDDYFAADSVSVKNYDDEPGATSQFEDKEIQGKEAEGVMEIAERLSKLRSIGKTEESARKYILETDTSAEELEPNDHMSELLGPKRLDFEVIDFDQFGAQPPDLPLNHVSSKMHHHGGKEMKAKKPESHIRVLEHVRVLEQEMKGLHDNTVKRSTPEKKQLRKERGTGALELPAVHVIPRLCNMCNEEGARGQDVSDTHSLSGRTGSSKLRLPDSLKPKRPSEAASGSPIRRSKSTMPDLKGSPVREETRRRTEDHKRLEECCNRVNLSTAKLEEQSRKQEEVNRKLERECAERLKSEAKLMILGELLPSVEANVKSLCDRMLSMEAQLQEQVGLRNKLEEERHERMQLQDQVNKLEQEREEREEQIDKLLKQETQERLQLAAKLDTLLEQERQKQEDQIIKLERSLEQERMQFVTKLEEQVDLRNKLEGQERMRIVAKLNQDLELERQERLQLAAQLGDLRNRLEAKQYEEQIRESASKLDEKLVNLTNQVESLTSQLNEQTQLKEELQVKLGQGLQKMHEEMAHRVEKEISLKDLKDQVLLLATQLQEQVHLRKELEERMPTTESLSIEEDTVFTKMLDEQKEFLKEAEMLKSATEKKVELLNQQVQTLEMLFKIVETKENVHNLKERATRQTMWTILQALCVGVGLVSFIVAHCRSPRSSLHPT